MRIQWTAKKTANEQMNSDLSLETQRSSSNYSFPGTLGEDLALWRRAGKCGRKLKKRMISSKIDRLSYSGNEYAEQIIVEKIYRRGH